MKLYLIRHAHALDAEEDPERPLSKRGRKQVCALAEFLRETSAFEANEIWHSPLARSIETAQLLAKKLKLEATLTQVSGLEGHNDPNVILRKLQRPRKDLAIVGHEPHLSALTSLLVCGQAEPPRFKLKKSAIVALEQIEDRWMVCWQISPDVVP